MNKPLRNHLHILYIVQYFNLPNEPGGSRAYQFSRSWVKKGHRVTVLTSNLNHKTLSPSNGSSEIIDGIRVIRLRTYNNIRGSFGKRILNFLSFAFLACLRGLTVPRFDLVYASSTPLTVGIPGYFLSVFKNKPLYFEVRDLWPESAVVAGVLTNKWVIKLAELIERRCYRRAVKVIAVTEGMRRGVIRKGKNPDDVLSIPHGIDDWMIEVKKGKPFNFPFDPKDHFICTYIGAHGRWNKLETILNCAQQLEGTNIRFLLIGDGDYKVQLQDHWRQFPSENLYFHDPVPKKQIFHYLSQSHVALICAWDHPFQAMLIANKVFDYMAAGCPIVAATRGETENLIQKADCGWPVEPERPRQLAELILSLSQLPAGQLQQKGLNGRNFALKHYLRSDLASKLEDTFPKAYSERVTA